MKVLNRMSIFRSNVNFQLSIECFAHFIYIDSNHVNFNKKYAYSINKHISSWIDDLTYLQHWKLIFFNIDRRRNHMQIAIFLFFHWLHQLLHQKIHRILFILLRLRFCFSFFLLQFLRHLQLHRWFIQTFTHES